MKKRRLCFLLTVMLLGTRALYAKDNFQLWTELKYSHTLPDKKLTLRWAQENRLYNNASQYGLFNTTFGFDYRVFRWLRPGYFQRLEKRLGLPTEIRLMPQTEFLADLGPIQFENRSRFELRFFTEGPFRFTYRNRIKISHTFKVRKISLTPYGSEEIFLETKRNNPVQNRMILGNAFGFYGDRIVFELYYMWRWDKGQFGFPSEDFDILGTSLGFKF